MKLIRSDDSFIDGLFSKRTPSAFAGLFREFSSVEIADSSSRKVPMPGRSRRLLVYRYWVNNGANFKTQKLVAQDIHFMWLLQAACCQSLTVFSAQLN